MGDLAAATSVFAAPTRARSNVDFSAPCAGGRLASMLMIIIGAGRGARS